MLHFLTRYAPIALVAAACTAAMAQVYDVCDPYVIEDDRDCDDPRECMHDLIFDGPYLGCYGVAVPDMMQCDLGTPAPVPTPPIWCSKGSTTWCRSFKVVNQKLRGSCYDGWWDDGCKNCTAYYCAEIELYVNMGGGCQAFSCTHLKSCGNCCKPT